MTYSEFRNQFSNIQRFVQAYGSLTYEEVGTLIDEDMCPIRIKPYMIDLWREARRIVKLRKVHVCYSENRELEIIFDDYNSNFNGNDFEYSYSLDADSTVEFMRIIPHPWAEPEINIEEWLIENIDCIGHGLDLQRKWEEMGLHGKNVDTEEYAGGIHHTFYF